MIISFSLENAAGGDDFIPPATLPWYGNSFGSPLYSNTEIAIGDFDSSSSGSLNGPFDLGNIFPTGMNVADLQSFLTVAIYAAPGGGGSPEFDLVVVPEPGTMSLLAIAGLGMLLIRRRRRA
jgi:hypothetical protein